MIGFLFTIVGISLSGVMAPGPITAATLAAGARNRHAGAWICVGHVLVELPLVVFIAAGLGVFLESKGVRAGIGLVGGILLLLMGVQLLASLRRSTGDSAASVERHRFLDRRLTERGRRGEQVISLVCAVLLLGFGGKFVCDAAAQLVR
ncbi:MAG: LysE family transporter [Thermoguttaceae bacterium]